MTCPLCGTDRFREVYSVDRIPVFQNKVYPTFEAAHAVQTGSVRLNLCDTCGFAYNSAFDPGRMQYDEFYQNEQACSSVFEQHLDAVCAILEHHGIRRRRIVEIGCGKGTFLQKLWEKGYDAVGVDPAYEGSDPRILRTSFPVPHSKQEGDVFILRHVLEHIADPLNFLHTIARGTGYHGMIYIEVPDLDWIRKNQAFWDVFYEHCNYFSAACLRSLFGQADCGTLFGGQYLYVWGDLSTLRQQERHGEDSVPRTPSVPFAFREALDHVRRFLAQRSPAVIWGAGAKGATVANLLDPDRRGVPFLVDINPRKQGRYLGGSGHRVVSPETMKHDSAIVDILVTNGNYLNEIKALAGPAHYRFHVLTSPLATLITKESFSG